MAKKVYIGVNNVARKVKKMYVGVGNVARKVKKAYIGVGGVARPFWTGGEPSYFGNVTSLPLQAGNFEGATIGNHAIFFKGEGTGGDGIRHVTFYDQSLTQSVAQPNTSTCDMSRAVTVGSYAFFIESGYYIASYNSSLTFTRTSVNFAASSVGLSRAGDYCIVNNATNIKAISQSLTVSKATGLDASPANGSMSTAGGCALVVGGENFPACTRYDASLTKAALASLSIARREHKGASVGSGCVFAGGVTSTGTVTGQADGYNSSLTRTTLSSLSEARCLAGKTSTGDYAVFCGGFISADNYSVSKCVELYDTSFVRTVIEPIKTGRYLSGCATIGPYILVAGGFYYNGSSQTRTTAVEAYTI